MADYFFDTSALIKRYVRETGTDWAISVLDPPTGNSIFLVQITPVEVASAVARRKRGGSLSAAQATTITQDFRYDLIYQYWQIESDQSLIDRAVQMAEKHTLRGYDAVQLAAALLLQEQRSTVNLPAITFVAADQALNTAAVAEGLQVDDPNLH